MKSKRTAKWIIKAVAVALCIVVVIGSALGAAYNFLFYGGTGHGEIAATSFFLTGDCKGFFVRTKENLDFPSATGLGSTELKEELEQIIDYAVSGGFNAIFFEARPDAGVLYRSKYYPTSQYFVEKQGGFTLFDPLRYLSKRAAEENLELYAVVNAYYAGSVNEEQDIKSPVNTLKDYTFEQSGGVYFDPSAQAVQQLLADSCVEIAKNYAISGVMIDGLSDPVLVGREGYTAAVEQTLSLVRKGMNSLETRRRLGIVVDGIPGDLGYSIPPSKVGEWVEQSLVQLVISNLYTPLREDAESYQEYAAAWGQVAENQPDARVVVGSPAYKLQKEAVATRAVGTRESTPYDDPEELAYQLFIASMEQSLSGAVFESYGDLLLSDPTTTEYLMSYLWRAGDAPVFELNIPTSFTTNPDTAATVTTSKYYITGTSDPNLPLTMNGQEVARYTKSGSFGILVDVPLGTTTYTFAQGNAIRKVSLTRVDPQKATPQKISEITKSSIFPTRPFGAKAGETITISCTAPSGSTVKAAIGNTTITLKQTAATAAAGIAATFKGSYTVPTNLPANEVTNIGKVTYTLTYGGKNTTYRSAGDIYVAGTNAKLAVEVTDFHSAVFTDATTIDQYVTSIKTGARDYVVGSEGSRVILESGGYVESSTIKFLTGAFDLQNKFFDIFYESTDKAEIFTLPGTSTNAYVADMTDRGVSIKFYNSSFEHTNYSSLTMELFESVTAENNPDGSATLSLLLKPGQKLWGYDISFDEKGNTIIYCKKPPKISTKYARPLEGISIVVDPGHRGTDPGALGAAGVNGPVEAKLNMALSATLKYRLEQLGATVIMTRRDNDTSMTLQDRLVVAQQHKPDFFLAVHHNSTNLNYDANNASGVQVYYHYDIAQPLSNHLVQQISSRVGRDYDEPEYGAYYVTRISYAPAVLIEAGFISNPLEQELSADRMVIYREACGIAQAVVDTLVESQ